MARPWHLWLAAALAASRCACAPPRAEPPPSALPGWIAFEAARRERVVETVRVSGEAAASEDGVSLVASPLPGVVVSLAAAGADLVRGAAVARLRPAGVVGPEAEARAQRARSEAERLELLAAQGLVPRAQARLARAEADRLARALAERGDEREISAPIAGTVDEVRVRVGEVVAAGQPISRLIDRTRLEVRVAVPDVFAAALEVGADAAVALASEPDRALPARVASRAAGPEPGTRAVAATLALLARAAPAARPGVGAVAEIEIGRAREAVTVPRAALLARGGTLSVLVRQGDSVVTRAVEAGARRGERVEITSGLEAGEAVVSRGAELLVPPAVLPPPPPGDGAAWIVVPPGRGAAVAAALAGEGELALEAPRRIDLDARALLALGLPVTRAVQAAAAAGSPDPEAVVVHPPEPPLQRLWSGAGPGEPVDAVAVAPAAARRLLAAARRADPRAERFGAETPRGVRGRILFLAGLLVVLAATGSLRAGAALLVFALVLGEAAGLPADPELAALVGLGASAAGLAVVAALDRSPADPPLRAGLARVGAACALTAAAAVAALLPDRGADRMLVALALAAAGATAAALVVLLERMPGAPAFARPSIDRLPPGPFALALAGLGVAGLLLAPVPQGTVAIAIPAAPQLERGALEAGVEHMARAALGAGARAALAATRRDGTVEFLASGPDVRSIAAAAAAAAPRGLGIGLVGLERLPDPVRRPLVGARVRRADAALALALALGPVRRDGLTLALLDPGEAGLLPLETVEGPPVLAREWADPPPPPALRRAPGPRLTAPPPGQGPVFALLAFLPASIAALFLVARERRHGASARLARERSGALAARIAGAAAGTAAIAAGGMPQLETAALLALGWAAALAVALAAARLWPASAA